MVTLAQRLEALRTERGLSRPALSAALGFPKNAVEKFETGRQTPSKEQQESMAEFFGVSLFYLRGESGDRTRQDAWMEGDFDAEEPGHVPLPAAPKPKPKGETPPAGGAGSLLDSLLTGKPFQQAMHDAVLEVLRSPRGRTCWPKRSGGSC